MGSTIGGLLIPNHSEFLKTNISSVILAGPSIAYGGQENFVDLIKKRIEWLEKITCSVPVTIISGENDSVCSPSEHAIPMFEALRKSNSNVYYHQIGKAEHSPHNMLDLLAYFFCHTEDSGEVMEGIKANEVNAIEIFDEYLKRVLEASRRTYVEIP